MRIEGMRLELCSRAGTEPKDPGTTLCRWRGVLRRARCGWVGPEIFPCSLGMLEADAAAGDSSETELIPAFFCLGPCRTDG